MKCGTNANDVFVDVNLTIFTLTMDNKNDKSTMLTDGCVNFSRILDAVVSSLDAEVTQKSKEEGRDPHGNVWES